MAKKWIIEEIVFLYFFHKRKLSLDLQAKIFKRTVPSIENKKRRLKLNYLNEMSYIIKTKAGTYTIIKTINYKKKHFGTYKKLEDAKQERDLLIKYNWDIEKVCECADESINNKIIFNNKAVAEVS